MRAKYPLRLLLCSMLCWLGYTPGHAQVNAIIGDESYRVVHGVAPVDGEDEVLRIQTHLAWVEAKLRMADTGHLDEGQRRNRGFILDLLHEYWLAGQFPANRDYPGERRPCFIDSDGNLCAVGYLLAQTRGLEAAEFINDRYQYDYLLDIQDASLEEWATANGLSLEECAMIQPTYWFPTEPTIVYERLKPGYGISSAAMGGINLAGNIYVLSGKTTNKWPARISLVTGGAQLLLGVLNVKKETTQDVVNGGMLHTRYRAQNNVSYFNIAMGSATVVTGTLNLLMNANRKKALPLSLYSYPNEANSLSMGLHFSHRF